MTQQLENRYGRYATWLYLPQCLSWNHRKVALGGSSSYQAWTWFAIISCPPPDNHSQTGRGVYHHVSEAVEKGMMYSKPSKKGHECQKITMLEICFCTFWTSRWNLGLWTIAAIFAALFFSCWGGKWGQFTNHKLSPLGIGGYFVSLNMAPPSCVLFCSHGTLQWLSCVGML